jgi:hypothetical protein
MLTEELKLDREYPCPICSSYVWEVVNFAAIPFTVNTLLGKGSKCTSLDLKEVGGKRVLTIPGLRYEFKCINCGYTTSPEELGIINPSPYIPGFGIPIEIDFQNALLIGRVELKGKWKETYLKLSS